MNYSVVISVAGCNVIDTFDVLVTAYPAASVTVSPDTVICQGGTAALSASSGGASYVWSPATGLSNPNIATPAASPVASTTYTLTLTDNNGCTASDTVRVTVASLAGFFTNPDVIICGGTPTQLNASGGSNYFWYPATGLSNVNIPNPVANPDVSMMYNVVISAPLCNLIDTLPVYVELHPFPTVQAKSSNDILCDKPFTTLTATGAASYVWSPNYNLTDTTSTSLIASPEVTTTYYLLGTDIYGCTASSEVTVAVPHDGQGILLVPNAFSPDGDGLNDCYGIKLNGATVSDYVFKIYNRWGNEVFSTTSMNDCWDGNFNGQPQELGVYVYYYKAKTSYCGNIQGKGNLTLIR